MATVTDDPTLQRPRVTPVGDVPAATARAATSSANQLTAPPTRALPAPSNFIGDAAGNVQANTPSAQWKTAPGAQRTFFPAKPAGPLGNAASRLTAAPDLQTSPGAGPGPGMVDPPAAPGRGAVVAPSPTGGSTLSLAEPPGKPNLALEPQPLEPRMIQPGPPAAAAPTGEDISGGFAKRTAAARAGVDAGGVPRALTPGQTAAVNDTLKAATAVPPVTAPAGPAVSTAERIGGAAGRATKAAVRLGASPVETVARTSRIGKAIDKVPGLKKTAGGGSAAALALAAIPSALESLNRDTGDYYDRLGVQRPTGDGVGALAKDVGVRTAGVLSDFGAAIPDTLIGMLNGTGLTDIRPFASSFADRQGEFKPHYATDAGGFAVRPSSLSAADQAANEQFTTDQLKAELAQRTGQAAPAPATAPGTSRQQLASTPGAAPAAGAPAPVEFITADTSGAIAPPDATGHQRTGAEAAMDSSQPGTAVINGQVKSSADIAAAAKRLNTVPSSAFTDSTVGGPTLSTEQAVNQRVAALRDSRAASQLTATPGSDGSDSESQATVKELMGQITDALRNGKKATARTLIAQLGAFGQIAGGNADRAQRAQQAPKTAAELAQEQAQTQLTEAQAASANLSVEQEKRLATIQAQLATETDPAKRKSLLENAQALSGKGSSADKLMTLEVPVGTGINAQTLHLPYDPATNQLLVPNGYAELLHGLQGSQPQAK